MSLTHDQTKLIDVLLGGGIAVMPTDTLLGVLGSALKSQTVERIYQLRRHVPSKPFIILIGNLDQLKYFHIKLSPQQSARLARWWPGPISAIINCLDPSLFYLHRGQNSLAFRLPAEHQLQALLREVGPLVAPSANQPGQATAMTLEQAETQLGDKIDLYYAPSGQGPASTQPSTLARLNPDGTYELVRSGVGDGRLAL